MASVLIEGGIDVGAVWHHGDPLREQRNMRDGTGVVDLSNRDVLKVSGEDRLTYLNLLCTAKVDMLSPGESASCYLLDYRGRILFYLSLSQTESETWVWTEPRWGDRLARHLESMKFRMDVSVVVRPDMAVAWVGDGITESGAIRRAGPVAWRASFGGSEVFLARSLVPSLMETGRPAGMWAYTALRIAAGAPRFGVDTDARTIPNELGVPSAETTLDKGCYPGQETVAKILNRGSPPRRLVRLHFDGSHEKTLDTGTPLLDSEGVPVGTVGSASYHHELGFIGLGLIASRTNDHEVLTADGVATAIEPLENH